MRFTADLAVHAAQRMNPLGEREVILRGYKIAVIENTGTLKDQFDVIDLSDNEINDDGIRAFCEALKINDTLESLTITNGTRGSTKITAAGAQLIANMLAVNRSLKSADLRGNGLDSESKKKLRDAAKGRGVKIQV